MNWLNILRVAICIIILGYSCVTDWKIRRAPNRLWYIMGAIGLVLGIYELYCVGFQQLSGISLDIRHRLRVRHHVFPVLFLRLLRNDRHRRRGCESADRHSDHVHPVSLRSIINGTWLPITDVTRSFIFGFAVFGNALVLNLVVPVAIFIYNLFKVPLGELKANPIGSFTGYKSGVEGLKG